MSEPRLFSMRKRDVAAAAEALADAFFQDPIMCFMAPEPERRRAWLPSLQGEGIRLCLPYGHVYGARARGDEVAGVICLVPPGRFPLPPLRSLGGAVRALLRSSPRSPRLRHLLRGAYYVGPLHQAHLKGPHWYVQVLGVCPGHQGEGLGRLLMERAIELSERDGCPLYLETMTEGNVAFYKRLDFEVRGYLEPHPAGPTTWLMVRESMGL